MPKVPRVELSSRTKICESDARTFQAAFMMKGLKATGRSKSFSDLILERPRDPYNTIATRVLSVAINKNPLQSQDQFGVLVSDEDLIDGWIKVLGLMTVFLPMKLPKHGIAGLFLYGDQSCIVTFPTETPGKSRAVTLPFRIRSAPIRSEGGGKSYKVSVSQGKKRLGVRIKVGDGKPCPLSWDMSSHERFRGELAIEVEAVLMQMRAEAPTYHVSPAHVRESDKGPDGQIKFPAGPKMYFNLGPEMLGWLIRNEVSIFDLHLPYLTMTTEQIYAIRGLMTTMCALAWRKAGLAEKPFPASLLLKTGSPLSGEGVHLTIEQAPYDRGDMLMRDDFSFIATECEKMKLPGEGEILRFLDLAKNLLIEATDGMTIYGYRHSFTGRNWELEPVVLADIPLNDMKVDDTEDALIARYAFQARHLRSLRGTRSKAPEGLWGVYRADLQNTGSR